MRAVATVTVATAGTKRQCRLPRAVYTRSPTDLTIHSLPLLFLLHLTPKKCPFPKRFGPPHSARRFFAERKSVPKVTGLRSVHPFYRAHKCAQQTETHTETMQHVTSVAIGRIENCSQFCTVNWKYAERECKGLSTAHELQ